MSDSHRVARALVPCLGRIRASWCQSGVPWGVPPWVRAAGQMRPHAGTARGVGLLVAVVPNEIGPDGSEDEREDGSGSEVDKQFNDHAATSIRRARRASAMPCSYDPWVRVPRWL